MQFKSFWLDTNYYQGWIESKDDWENAILDLAGFVSPPIEAEKYLLFAQRNSITEYRNFGYGSDYRYIMLWEWLNRKGMQEIVSERVTQIMKDYL
jgi:hypothetical protein